MNKEKIKPKLRFKGYKEDWKLELLENTCKVTTGGKDTQNRIDGGAYPFFVRSNTVERINSYSFDGEAILTSGDGVGVGKNFHYINGKFDFHQRVYALLEFKENYSGKFIYQLFVEKFHKRVMRLSAKNSVDSVRMNMITEMDIGFPTLPEQQKIASFLSAVDEKIQQLTRKKELLEQYKKGVMQQLFSGKLRFKDEYGKAFPKWEEKRLGDISIFLDGKRKPIKGQDRVQMQGSYPYYGASGIIDYINDYIFDEDIILLGEDGENIISRNLPLAFRVSGKCWVNNHAHVIKPNQTTDIDFLTYSLERINYIIYNTGTAQPKLNQEVCRNIPLSMPCFEEQKKIANYLFNIDRKIEIVNKQITQAQTFKKGLLQQMFV